ncbi:hydantoinase B/oxoprolinase family protein [Baekduia soli]|uniref:Hydantoinase B/oxoprolinase family protein n=1 Tax=Baekduia soli TaxID=496014 RepID=A0A5B8U6B9_9ACTN|nr:hydantoinase B/oxoprolinase family protein [Baekduia soli]QEC48445.1 hydantoinase B/oxoprolinase family protein [Baekduia soli]
MSATQSTLPDFVREHDIDQVTLDIIENTLSNARYEMDRVLETTAVSPVIREQSDQFPLIADRHARMVIGQFGSAIPTIIEHSPYEVSDLRDGDVIALNDPYMCEGSVSHTPDMLLLRPIFFEDDLVGYASQWGNLIDVGGTAAGSMPISARSIYHEGVRMPPIKLYDQGKLNEEALRLFCHNTRAPKEVEADIKAIAAGTAAGAARVIELCERYGKETYLEACDAILDRTRSAVIELIRTYLPDEKRLSFEDFADDDGLGTGPIKLKMTMWRSGDTINVDWEGTDGQVPGSVNFYLNPEMFKMFVGVFLIMAFAPDVVFNDGYSDIINVNIPEGSVLKPEFPAPLGNRLTLMARHFDVFGAVFSKMLGLQFAVSGSYGTSPNFVYSGTDSKGENYQILEILYGGIPARPAGDGLDGHSWWPLFKAVPTEYLEKYYPLRVESYSVRTDSGGAGYHRGGHGVAKVYTFLEDGLITFQDDRARTHPWGVNGGMYGESSEKTLIRADGREWSLPSKVENVPVHKGDRLVFSTAGAGGLGDPLDREPERVAKDVRAGLVTVEAAREDYAVELGPDGEADAEKTAAAREAKRASREPRPDFDFGPLPEIGELRKEIAAERREFEAALANESDSG